jgi:hypothetical protein
MGEVEEPSMELGRAVWRLVVSYPRHDHWEEEEEV